MKVDWHGEELNRKITTEIGRNLSRAAIFLTNKIKERISTKSPPVSAPHTPPNVGEIQGGELRRSITWEVDEGAMKARVGSNKIYARYLEKGTNKMIAREFLEPTLEDNKEEVARLIAGRKIT